MRAIITAALFAASVSQPPAQQPTVLEVHLSSFRFTPNLVQLEHGRPYILRLVNDGGGGHDFTARDFFTASLMTSAERAQVTNGEIEVPSGQVREIRLTAPNAGTYALKCSHTFHKALGMKGKIIVR